jgi:hypothetical protein
MGMPTQRQKHCLRHLTNSEPLTHLFRITFGIVRLFATWRHQSYTSFPRGPVAELGKEKKGRHQKVTRKFFKFGALTLILYA